MNTNEQYRRETEGDRRRPKGDRGRPSSIAAWLIRSNAAEGLK